MTTSLLSVQDARVAELLAHPCDLEWFTFGGVRTYDPPRPGEKLVSRPLRWTSDELCPLTARHAKILADAFGLRLPTREEARSFSKFPHIPIQTLAWNDPLFGTVEGTRVVTKRIDDQLKARDLRGCIVDNEAKMWIDGASPGWALLVGFFDASGQPANTGAGAPGKPGYGPKGEPHNDLHVDYSMAPVLVWEG